MSWWWIIRSTTTTIRNEERHNTNPCHQSTRRNNNNNQRRNNGDLFLPNTAIIIMIIMINNIRHCTSMTIIMKAGRWNVAAGMSYSGRTLVQQRSHHCEHHHHHHQRHQRCSFGIRKPRSSTSFATTRLELHHRNVLQEQPEQGIGRCQPIGRGGRASINPWIPFVPRSFSSSTTARTTTIRRMMTRGSGGEDVDHDIGKIPPNMTGWTIDKVIVESIDLLRKQDVEEPDLSVYHLLSSSLDLSWETGFREVQQYHTSPTFSSSSSSASSFTSQVLSKEQAEDYQDKLRRRIQHEPIQYILEKWDFLDYTIQIKSPLLCPRPETEELVCKILEDGAVTESPINILDVGCGTGVIGIALADQIMDAFVHAIDIDPVAIEVSNYNAKLILGQYYNDQNACYETMLISAEDYVNPSHTYDIVVSNPPYIPDVDRDTMSNTVLQYENHQALFAGEDGMDVIRTIIQQLRTNWCHSGSVCYMVVDPSQPLKIKQYIEEELELEERNLEGDGNTSSLSLRVVFEDYYQDMFGKDRFVKLRVL